MSEEEKKAIELLKNKNTEYYYRFIDVRDAVSTLLNLIDKQKKEIEELKKDRKDNMQVIYGGRRFGTEGMVLKDYISKDKIREKIEKYEKNYIRQDKEELFNLTKITAGALSALQELLMEN